MDLPSFNNGQNMAPTLYPDSRLPLVFFKSKSQTQYVISNYFSMYFKKEILRKKTTMHQSA